MKKSLSHLPRRKRDELKRAVYIIREIVPDVEMIVLFGSHARGDWVEDIYMEGHITYEYKSDFDILVIVANSATSGRINLWYKLDRKIGALPNATSTTIISHDTEYVNREIGRGQYFFSDIKKEGIVLYDSGNFKLARRRKLDPQERARIAKADFKQWFTSASHFYDNFTFNLCKRRYKIAAFELHQATERYYQTIMLVFTHYKPKEHDLEKLGKWAGDCDPAFLPIFPRATLVEKHRFDLLKRAYIDARYDPGYKITRCELTYLSDRVQLLRRLTQRICKKKIASFA